MEANLRSILEEGIKAIMPDCNVMELSGAFSKLYDEITLFNPAYGLVNAQGQ